MNTELDLLSLNSAPQAVTLPKLITAISEAKTNITENFYLLGRCLGEIKTKKLYTQDGHKTFYQFLRDHRVDMSPADAERFIALTEDEYFQKNLSMGLSKMLELLKLEPQQRKRLLNEGVNVNGTMKPLESTNMNELKKYTRDLKREGKVRCDRCGRWVDRVKQIDGKFYGASGTHSCYDLEMEERRNISEGRIPAAQLDNVLDTLKASALKEVPPPEIQQEPINWLPESLYQLYGQLLKEQSQTGEINADTLKREKETLKKLVRLCQSRLREIQDTMGLLKELDSSD